MDTARTSKQTNNSTNPIARWNHLPLYTRIVIGLVIGVLVGAMLRPHWRGDESSPGLLIFARFLTETARIVLRMLSAIAPPLILIAVVRSLLATEIKSSMAGRLVFLLLLNTVVAICIGLLVANVLRPGAHAHLSPSGTTAIKANDPLTEFLDSVPPSILQPLVENNVIGVILLALAFGMAVRKLGPDNRLIITRAVEAMFELILIILHWILALVPLAVLCKVADILTRQGLEPFRALGWFILAVILALSLQGVYYLVRIHFGSWVRPLDLIRGTRDALVMAFSTASSTATMPLTYECLKDRVGLRPESASLGALVGANFNHDGTALYEAMCALFISQAIGLDLPIGKQLMVVLTSIVAAVGAAGIPEAGLVTMALVFNAVGLPITHVALLLPVDWFLDRCRTAINVMGDMNVSCLLEGKQRGELVPSPSPDVLAAVVTV
jgi:DAACS family dicarboxylate/amino acid:cation (Na+ or H+) symporter